LHANDATVRKIVCSLQTRTKLKSEANETSSWWIAS